MRETVTSPAKQRKPEVIVEDNPRLPVHEEVLSHEVPGNDGHEVELNEDRGVSSADQMVPSGQHEK